MEEKEIELKSEQMNEMLSQPPVRITRSGNGILLTVICFLIFLSWFIRYPDEVSGEVLVSSPTPPIELSNQGYVQLKALNVLENQIVKQGDLIAQFDSRVNSDDLLKAVVYLNRLKAFNNHFPLKIPVPDQELELGTFAERWTGLLAKIREWNSENALKPEEAELKFVRKEIAFREQLQAISNKKIVLSENEYALIEEQLKASERLAEQRAISTQSLVTDKHSRNQAMQSVQEQKEQAVQNLIALNNLRKEKLRMEHAAQRNHLQRTAEIQLLITGLSNAFRNWRKEAVWTAPCSGKVVFNKLLQVNRFYKTDEASLVIVPEKGTYQAFAVIPDAGAGKLKAGQKAFIELIDYPKTEFGMLEGKVDHITQIDKNGKYEVRILLSHKLKTTYNKEIPPKAQWKGRVIIITKDKRLLLRFFEQLTDLIK